MKTIFKYHFPLQEGEIDQIWKSAFFVFDTNALLDLYRYSPSTRDQVLNVLRKLNDNLWIPHQVGKEFLKNRPTVIADQISQYSSAKKILEKLVETASQEIEKSLNFRIHPFIDKAKFIDDIKKALSNVEQELESKRPMLLELVAKDDILEIISEIYNSKVGSAYDEETLKKKYELGKTRYNNKQPPGYEDAIGKNKKEGNDIYGDLILWFQIIDRAKAIKKPVILISNENKEDWWLKVGRRTIGFRPELRDELLREAKVEFYMYKSDNFINYAQTFLGLDVPQESIDEVKEVRIHDEMVSDITKSLSDLYARHSKKAEVVSDDSAERPEQSYIIYDGRTPPDVCSSCSNELIYMGYKVHFGNAGGVYVCSNCGITHHLLDPDY